VLGETTCFSKMIIFQMLNVSYYLQDHTCQVCLYTHLTLVLPSHTPIDLSFL
jgi:hypothetical protein